MQNKQGIIAEIERISTLKLVTQAYEEISVIRMQRIRSSVISTRDFLGALAQVFYDIKTTYKKQIEEIKAKKKGALPESQIDAKSSSEEVIEKNGKTVYVFLSPNTRLQGEIILKVFDNFLNSVKHEEHADVMIVGRFGRDLYEQQENKRPYLYFEMPESAVHIEDIRPIIFHLAKYDQVNIFHGRFENILHQNAVISNISGDEPMNKEEPTTQVRFMFEPSLEKILDFFETQILTILFKQTVFESQLAQYASRTNAMEEALQHIDDLTKRLYAEKRKINRLLSNRKQLETVSGISLWNS